MARKMGMFTGEFTSGTGTSQSGLFGQSVDVVREERMLIDRIFSIVDKDNSGTIDARELEEMFEVFDQDTRFLKAALARILSNADASKHGMITPQEFYTLLTDRFSAEDVENDPHEVTKVFGKMCGDSAADAGMKTQDRVITVESLYQIARQLGESITKRDVADMIKMFNRSYQAEKEKYAKMSRQSMRAGDNAPKPAEPPEPTTLSYSDFVECMKSTELDDGEAAVRAERRHRGSQWMGSSLEAGGSGRGASPNPSMSFGGASGSGTQSTIR
jgi:Ca2+-binding EF-hand superfamily protein